MASFLSNLLPPLAFFQSRTDFFSAFQIVGEVEEPLAGKVGL